MRKPRPTEHDEQAKLFQWAKLQEKRYPELALMFAIPNGGDRHPAVGAKMKAEGVKAGVPDIFLPVHRVRLGWVDFGLFVEMKRDSKEKPKAEQKKWLADLEHRGYRVEVGYGFEDARDKILAYLNGDQ